MIDDQLSFTDHIATTARSCRFALYNIRKIRPFLSEQAAQLLVQALVLPDWIIVMLSWAGLPACTIKPQLIQMQQPEWSIMSRKSSRYPSLHQVTATNSRSHHIQGTDVPTRPQLALHQYTKLASSNLCALQKLAFFCK